MADLFQPPPARWGLRGDPHLWAEMASTLAGCAIPPDAAQLDSLLQATFARLVGTPLDSSAPSIHVQRYAHGGMSSGQVSPAFWRETGFALLRARHAAIR
ncbi:MAG: hypothetical protein WCZ65_01755 [Lysobacteraceae bacterium]